MGGLDGEDIFGLALKAGDEPAKEKRRGGMASGAVRAEVRCAFAIQDCFGHDGTRGLSRAEKQHVVVLRHLLLLY